MNIKDIARQANVSISTVSRVINNTAKVNEDTRARVEKVLKETNYRPNSLARELQQKKTNTIGVIMSVKNLEISSVSETLNTIADKLKQRGYNMMLANSRFHKEEEFNFFRTFQEKRVDGIIYMANEFTEDHYDLLKNFPIPIVMIGQKYGLLDIPAAIHDDYHAAIVATEYLVGKGHKKIGYIGCPLNDEATGVVRRKGFDDTMAKHGLKIDDDYIALGDFSIDSGYEAAKEILNKNKEKELPSAIFATTDYMAIGAIKALKDQGIRVPEDISVIGFDDVHVAEFYCPPLTTIRTDKKLIGVWAVNHLLKGIENKTLDMEIFTSTYQLIERKSVIQVNESRRKMT